MMRRKSCVQAVLMTVLTIFPPSLPLVAQDSGNAVERSFDYIEEGKLDSAEICLKSALAATPDSPLNPFILNNLGTVQRRLGKYDDALISYTAALGHLPKNTVFLEARASLLAEMGQTENAVLDYSALIEERPADEEALYQRGLLYLQTGRDDLAETDFRRLMELYPNGVLPRLGLAALAKFREDFDEAEKIYAYLIDKNPANPRFYAGRAELYLLMNKPGKASADATRAISLEENPYHYIIRYRAKLLLHEPKSAEKDLAKAKELGYDNSKI
jgi:tetratricopeptide (TPR) repeat protein